MNHLRALFPADSMPGLTRSVLTLASGSSVAFGLSYLARPLLTRLYTPEAFGLLGFFLALVAVLSTAAAGRYEDALMLPAQRRDALSLSVLSFGLTVAATILSLAFWVWRARIAAFFGAPEAAPYLALVPAALLGTTLLRLLEKWLTREQRFRSVSGMRMAESGLRVPVQVAVGVLGGSPWGLIGGAVLGRLLPPLAFAAGVVRRHRGLLHDALRPARVRRLASRYSRFPMYSVPSALFGTGSMHLPALLLIYFFEADVVGFYAQSYGVLAVPLGLVGGSVGQVFFVRAAEARREGGLRPLTEGVFRRLVFLGLFPAAALTAAGPDLVAFVLGEAFREAGVYARLLAPWLFFVFASSPLSPLFDVLERQRANLVFSLVVFLGRAAALLLGGWLGDARLAIALFSLTGAVTWAGHTVWMLRLGRARLGRALRTVLRYGACAALPAAILLAAARWLTPGLVFAVAFPAGLLYLALALLLDRLRPLSSSDSNAAGS